MNNRSLFERFNKIAGKEGKWLSLRESAEDSARKDSESLRKRMADSPAGKAESDAVNKALADTRGQTETEKTLTVSPNTDMMKRDTNKTRTMNTEGIDFDTVSGHIKGQGKPANAKRELISDEKVQKRMQGMMDAKQEYNDQVEAVDRNISDKDSALKFLDGIGYVKNKNGKLDSKKNTDIDMNMALNMKPNGVAHARQYNGIDHDQIKSLNENPSHMENMKNQDLVEISKSLLTNKLVDENGKDNSWQVATDLIENNLSDNAVKELMNLGTPIPTGEYGGAFNPQIPVEYILDEDGNYTGFTNIDAMSLEAPTAGSPERDAEGNPMDVGTGSYRSHFGKEPTKNRAIHILQKLLLTGGKDFLSFRNENMLPQHATIDHAFGRSEENPKRFEQLMKESPLAMFTTMGNMNQFKQKLGDDVMDLGNATKPGEIGDDLEKYIEYRAGSTQWDKIRNADNAVSDDGETSTQEMTSIPESLDEWLDMDEETLKDFTSDYAGSRPHGLDVRNFGKLGPERGTDEVDWNDNSWSGGRGFGYYDKINPFRKAIAAAIHNNDDYKGIRSSILEGEGLSEESLEGLSKSARNKLETKIRGAQSDWRGHNYMDDVRGMSTIYGLGRLSNEDFVGMLKGKLNSLIKSSAWSEEERKSLLDDANGNLDAWLEGTLGNKKGKGGLNKWFTRQLPEGEAPEDKEGHHYPAPRVRNAIQLGADSATPTAIKALNGSQMVKDGGYLTDEEIKYLKEHENGYLNHPRWN